MDYIEHKMTFFFDEIYPSKKRNLNSIENVYKICVFPGVLQKQVKYIKEMKEAVGVLNSCIVQFSKLQELLEDSQMDLEDKNLLKQAMQEPYYLSVYTELKKIEPILLWKTALWFVDFMYQNYDEIIKEISNKYDITKSSYKYICMISCDTYIRLIEVIKRGIFKVCNLKYKECSIKEVMQLLNYFKENTYVQWMLCYLASNYSKELYILGCTSAAVYEILDKNLDKEMEKLING